MVTKSTARVNVAMTQPELPHIGVGHRHLAPAPSPRGCVAARSVARHFAAQQHLVADDRPRGSCRERLASATPVAIWFLRSVGVAESQIPCSTFSPCRCGDFRDLIEPVVDRIGAHAIGDSHSRARSSSICAASILGRQIERRLRAAKRRVGNAVELLAWIERRRRHRHRLRRATTTRDDDGAVECEQTDRFSTIRVTVRGSLLPTVVAADMVRHFNQDCADRWTKASGLAISSRQFARRKPQIGPNRLSICVTRPIANNNQRTKLNRLGHVCPDARACSPPCSRRRLCCHPVRPWPRAATPSRRNGAAGGPTPPRTPQRRIDEFAEASKLVSGPGRQSGMRLARPPRRQPAVARRYGHRLPASRSLRPLRLPGRPYPGGVPLRGPSGQYRPEIAPEPECAGARLLAQPGRPADGGRRGVRRAKRSTTGQERRNRQQLSAFVCRRGADASSKRHDLGFTCPMASH